jgi:hypothetical protein
MQSNWGDQMLRKLAGHLADDLGDAEEAPETDSSEEDWKKSVQSSVESVQGGRTYLGPNVWSGPIAAIRIALILLET